MLPLSVLMLSLSANPTVITDEKSGTTFSLPAAPELCLIIPQAKRSAACAPSTAADIETERAQLNAAFGERTRILASARTKDAVATVVVTSVEAKKRRIGNVPVGYVKRFFDDLANQLKEDDGKLPDFAPLKDGIFEIENHGGVTLARAEYVAKMAGTLWYQTNWMLLTPTTTVTLSVASRSPAVDRATLGQAVLATLSVPEKMRIDLTGQTSR